MVPDGLHILVFGEVLGQVVAVSGDDVNHSTWYIGCVKYLQKSFRRGGLKSIWVPLKDAVPQNKISKLSFKEEKVTFLGQTTRKAEFTFRTWYEV